MDLKENGDDIKRKKKNSNFDSPSKRDIVPLEDVTEFTVQIANKTKRRSSKRVSFANTKHVKEYVNSAFNEWGKTYEQKINNSDGSADENSVLSNKRNSEASNLNAINIENNRELNLAQKEEIQFDEIPPEVTKLISYDMDTTTVMDDDNIRCLEDIDMSMGSNCQNYFIESLPRGGLNDEITNEALLKTCDVEYSNRKDVVMDLNTNHESEISMQMKSISNNSMNLTFINPLLNYVEGCETINDSVMIVDTQDCNSHQSSHCNKKFDLLQNIACSKTNDVDHLSKYKNISELDKGQNDITKVMSLNMEITENLPSLVGAPEILVDMDMSSDCFTLLSNGKNSTKLESNLTPCSNTVHSDENVNQKSMYQTINTSETMDETNVAELDNVKKGITSEMDISCNAYALITGTNKSSELENEASIISNSLVNVKNLNEDNIQEPETMPQSLKETKMLEEKNESRKGNDMDISCTNNLNSLLRNKTKYDSDMTICRNTLHTDKPLNDQSMSKTKITSESMNETNLVEEVAEFEAINDMDLSDDVFNLPLNKNNTSEYGKVSNVNVSLINNIRNAKEEIDQTITMSKTINETEILEKMDEALLKSVNVKNLDMSVDAFALLAGRKNSTKYESDMTVCCNNIENSENLMNQDMNHTKIALETMNETNISEGINETSNGNDMDVSEDAFYLLVSRKNSSESENKTSGISNPLSSIQNVILENLHESIAISQTMKDNKILEDMNITDTKSGKEDYMDLSDDILSLHAVEKNSTKFESDMTLCLNTLNNGKNENYQLRYHTKIASETMDETNIVEDVDENESKKVNDIDTCDPFVLLTGNKTNYIEDEMNTHCSSLNSVQPFEKGLVQAKSEEICNNATYVDGLSEVPKAKKLQDAGKHCGASALLAHMTNVSVIGNAINSCNSLNNEVKVNKNDFEQIKATSEIVGESITTKELIGTTSESATLKDTVKPCDALALLSIEKIAAECENSSTDCNIVSEIVDESITIKEISETTSDSAKLKDTDKPCDTFALLSIEKIATECENSATDCNMLSEILGESITIKEISGTTSESVKLKDTDKSCAVKCENSATDCNMVHNEQNLCHIETTQASIEKTGICEGHKSQFECDKINGIDISDDKISDQQNRTQNTKGDMMPPSSIEDMDIREYTNCSNSKDYQSEEIKQKSSLQKDRNETNISVEKGNKNICLDKEFYLQTNFKESNISKYPDTKISEKAVTMNTVLETKLSLENIDETKLTVDKSNVKSYINGNISMTKGAVEENYKNGNEHNDSLLCDAYSESFRAQNKACTWTSDFNTDAKSIMSDLKKHVSVDSEPGIVCKSTPDVISTKESENTISVPEGTNDFKTNHNKNEETPIDNSKDEKTAKGILHMNNKIEMIDEVNINLVISHDDGCVSFNNRNETQFDKTPAVLADDNSPEIDQDVSNENPNRFKNLSQTINSAKEYIDLKNADTLLEVNEDGSLSSDLNERSTKSYIYSGKSGINCTLKRPLSNSPMVSVLNDNERYRVKDDSSAPKKAKRNNVNEVSLSRKSGLNCELKQNSLLKISNSDISNMESTSKRALSYSPLVLGVKQDTNPNESVVNKIDSTPKRQKLKTPNSRSSFEKRNEKKVESKNISENKENSFRKRIDSTCITPQRKSLNTVKSTWKSSTNFDSKVNNRKSLSHSFRNSCDLSFNEKNLNRTTNSVLPSKRSETFTNSEKNSIATPASKYMQKSPYHVGCTKSINRLNVKAPNKLTYFNNSSTGIKNASLLKEESSNLSLSLNRESFNLTKPNAPRTKDETNADVVSVAEESLVNNSFSNPMNHNSRTNKRHIVLNSPNIPTKKIKSFSTSNDILPKCNASYNEVNKNISTFKSNECISEQLTASKIQIQKSINSSLSKIPNETTQFSNKESVFSDSNNVNIKVKHYLEVEHNLQTQVEETSILLDSILSISKSEKSHCSIFCDRSVQHFDVNSSNKFGVYSFNDHSCKIQLNKRPFYLLLEYIKKKEHRVVTSVTYSPVTTDLKNPLAVLASSLFKQNLRKETGSLVGVSFCKLNFTHVVRMYNAMMVLLTELNAITKSYLAKLRNNRLEVNLHNFNGMVQVQLSFSLKEPDKTNIYKPVIETDSRVICGNIGDSAIKLAILECDGEDYYMYKVLKSVETLIG